MTAVWKVTWDGYNAAGQRIAGGTLPSGRMEATVEIEVGEIQTIVTDAW